MSDTAVAMGAQGALAQGRGGLWLAAFSILLVTAMLASLGLGRLSIPLPVVAGILGHTVLPVPETWSVLEERVVLLVRAPRVLIAALSGAGLAMCGAALQGIFRNPLVSPQILGISSGAAFGGALAILLGFTGAVLIGSAFVFGIAALVVVGLIARIDGRTETATIVLAGIIVGALFSALVSLLQFVADPDSSLPAIVGWLMGSFASATWGRLALAAPPILIGIVGFYLLRFRVNILSLGDDEARSFGVSVERDRWIFFALAALATGATVSVAGVIGWVGLVVPHAARLLVGEDNRVLVPASALLGGAYLVVIDTIARTATAAEIPLSVLTAIVGAPVFAVLLRRSWKRERGA
ncbi:FecCD family ABC transporter permease [Oricola thermophila]|uniref:Iron ABC transporter permease n=1 Tax=Oricola thermophila TaxID=2742145 RepID=A0A6N1VG83_9HYPH|nr:iron ABC transporter permease [Oricola thermophila]QKV18655.1 iron ABC transporter permease [Oricola thermophila]